jgi:hypothetical protein
MRTGIVLALVAVSSLLVVSCSSSPLKPDTVSWGSVDDSARGETSKAKQEENGPKLTAKEYAAKFDSSIDCEYAAREQYGKNPKNGLALLAACMKRSDFIVLDVFTENPWAKAWKDPQRFHYIAQVVANRGGLVVSDMEKLQQARVPIYSVAQALERPDQTVGRVVLARALYTGPDKQRPELATYKVTDVVLDAETNDFAGKIPAIGEPTGQMLLVEAKPGDESPGPQEEYIIVGEVIGAEERFNDEESSDQKAIVLKTMLRVRPYGYFR